MVTNKQSGPRIGYTGHLRSMGLRKNGVLSKKAERRLLNELRVIVQEELGKMKDVLK